MLFNKLMALLVIAAAMRVPPDEKGPLLPNSSLVLKSEIAGNEYDLLVKIASANNVPLGIVGSPGKEDPACSKEVSVPKGAIKVSSLLNLLNRDFPQGKASLEGGILKLVPAPLPKQAINFLKLRLASFRSGPSSHSVMGANLWMFIEAEKEPGKASSFAGSTEPTVENLPGLNTTNETVQENLNAIVSLGQAGAWVLDVKKLDEHTSSAKPFDIAGYSGLHSGSRMLHLCAAP